MAEIQRPLLESLAAREFGAAPTFTLLGHATLIGYIAACSGRR